MKIFCCSQIKDIDAFTIANEPIKSIDLMERAAFRLLQYVVPLCAYAKRFAVFAGPGNNGGDGVALARMLTQIGYLVDVYILQSKNYSNDLSLNVKRLEQQGIVSISYLASKSDFPDISKDTIIVDALFGSGLTRPLEGLPALLVSHLNETNAKIISVDIPSGLFGENNPSPNLNPVIKAWHTFTLQFPKLSFIFPENSCFVGEWQIVDIGLHPEIIAQKVTPYRFVNSAFAKSLYLKRLAFGHKGTFGHALVVAGSYGMMGAAALCTKACLRAGAGLVTAHIPKKGYTVMQNLAPEALAQIDANDERITMVPELSKYSAVAFGPGVGSHPNTVEAFLSLLRNVTSPLVVDADGLNILASNSEMLALLPENTVLTPHVGEFNRLFGATDSAYERLILAQKKSAEHKVVIVLKGAHTQVVTPSGEVFINSSGNSGLASGGSGDVLTGLITGLLAQGYTAENACVLAVYLHGLAADILVREIGKTALVANVLVESIGEAFKTIENDI